MNSAPVFRNWCAAAHSEPQGYMCTSSFYKKFCIRKLYLEKVNFLPFVFAVGRIGYVATITGTPTHTHWFIVDSFINHVIFHFHIPALI